MLLDIALTAGSTFPFYLGTLLVLTKQYDKRFSLLLRLFMLSTLSTIPLFLLKFLHVDQAVFQVVFGPLAAILILAFLEEILKSVFLFLQKEFRLSYIYPIVIGIGFAFFENISYLVNISFSGTFIVIALIRLLMDSTAHAVFTCTVAYFFRKGRRSMKTWYYLLGIVVSGSLHGLFNLLHHWEMNYLAVPLLIIIIYWLHVDQEPVHEVVAHPVHRHYLHRQLRFNH